MAEKDLLGRTPEKLEALQREHEADCQRVHELATELLSRVRCGGVALPEDDDKCWCDGTCDRPLVAELEALIKEVSSEITA